MNILEKKIGRRDFLRYSRLIPAALALSDPLLRAAEALAGEVPCDSVCGDEGIAQIYATDRYGERRHHIISDISGAYNVPVVSMTLGKDFKLVSDTGDEDSDFLVYDGSENLKFGSDDPQFNRMIQDGIIQKEEQLELLVTPKHLVRGYIQSKYDAVDFWIRPDTEAFVEYLMKNRSDLGTQIQEIRRRSSTEDRKGYALGSFSRTDLGRAISDYAAGKNRKKIESALDDFVERYGDEIYIALAARIFEPGKTRLRGQTGWSSGDSYELEGRNTRTLRQVYETGAVPVLALLRTLEKGSDTGWYYMDSQKYNAIEKRKARGTPNAYNNGVMQQHWVGIMNPEAYELIKNLWPDGFDKIHRGDLENIMRETTDADGNPIYPRQYKMDDMRPQLLNPGYNFLIQAARDKKPVKYKGKTSGGWFSTTLNEIPERNPDLYMFR